MYNLGMSKQKARKEEKEWDDYWTKKRTKSQAVYRIIASFYRQYIIKKTLNHFIETEFKKKSKLLHAGAGSGQVDEDIRKNYDITALDISSQALALYKFYNGKKSNLLLASIFDIPVKKPTFDGIYNLGVMEHFIKEEDEKILKEFNRVLKTNGKIVLFWPPKFGVSVMFLNTVHFILNNIFGQNIRLHPKELSLIESRSKTNEMLKNVGFKMTKFYFGPMDAFTYCIIVAKKSTKK